MKILVLNAGSSSQKSRLYEIVDQPSSTTPTPLWAADTSWTPKKGVAELKVTANGQTITQELPTEELSNIIEQMLKTLWSGETRVISQPTDIDIVGHRVVHGGPHYHQSVLITPDVKAEIQHLASFAPLHNPENLKGIEAVERILSNIPQVAVFDTAYHSHLPQETMVYPGPYNWFEQGIRRYGFHGISHQYCARRSAQIVGRDLKSLRIVNCHLGNGCPLAAIRAGQSIDTTMGFTPLEGLMMGTRSGSIDPSILLYLQREHSYSAAQLDQILNKESGLKGISGVSGDMREVLQATKEGNQRAKLALSIYVYRLRYFIGAMIASLAGIDVLTFTGGVGENSSEVRAETCEAFSFLGLQLDEGKNATSPPDQDIATPESAVRVLIVHTEEDWEIARECWHIKAIKQSA
ncbi:MAG TPA: acetate kinase [Ktedonobacteraceae bacterium]|nr:acetate kinase [Ktedonobacteraceae bacterium]